MCTKKPSHAETNSLSSTWAPVILRFLLLYTGDLPLAESLTIETIGEHLCESGAVITDKTAITLLRRAFDKSIRIDAPMVHSNDPVIRALASPTPIQRAVVVLVGGLSLRLQTVSTITGLDTIELNRICLDAFDEVRLAALGRLEYSGTRQLQFVIASSGETYDLVPTEASQDVCTDILLGRQVLLKGTIPASKLGGPKVIRFESLVETGSN